MPVEEVATLQGKPTMLEQHFFHAHCALSKAAFRCRPCRRLGLARRSFLLLAAQLGAGFGSEQGRRARLVPFLSSQHQCGASIVGHRSIDVSTRSQQTLDACCVSVERRLKQALTQRGHSLK